MVRPLGAQSVGQALAAFLRTPRYEIFPTDDVLERVATNVPHEVTITVTASPRRGMPTTIRLAVSLAQLGYRVVPHLSARLIRDHVEVGQIIEALQAAGIRNVFVVAGDAREPAGLFPDSVSLLSALPPDHGLTEIGVTGYPESHPFIHDDVTIQAMWDKRRLATYIVSNMSFDPDGVKRWVDRVRRRGVDLPIHFLRGHPSWVARMFRPGGYDPGRFTGALMPELAQPERRIAGLHVFTFNEIEPTERWRREMLARLS